MKKIRLLVLSVALVSFSPSFAQQSSPVAERNIRAHMEFLASDALQGRGSATQNEWIAGTYIASQLRQYGIQPAGDNGQYLQHVPLAKTEFASAPSLSIGNIVWTHGKQMAVGRVGAVSFEGKLQKLKTGEAVQNGTVVYIKVGEAASESAVRDQITAPLRQGAVAVVAANAPQLQERFNAAKAGMPELPATANGLNFIMLNEEATRQMESIPDGAPVRFSGKLKPGEAKSTWNVIGVLPGTNAEAILLTAHMDHLGIGMPVNGDNIYNGADDDASGVTAVLELARNLGAGPKLRRTVYFVLFGSEETGGQGNQFFLDHSPLALNKIAANLEFEMIGRPDTKIPPQTLWLTGYERSNLGPELASHGARIVADPHSDQKFFTRSDNYALAKRGIVAQTVSSFGLHAQYHRPDDDLAHIDFAHMTRAIESMIEPVKWLANSDFVPTWNAGMKP